MLLSVREPPFIPHCATSLSLSLTKSHFISAAQLWKLMKCRDRLVLLALLENCVLRGRTLEPINLKWNPEPSPENSESNPGALGSARFDFVFKHRRITPHAWIQALSSTERWAITSKQWCSKFKLCLRSVNKFCSIDRRSCCPPICTKAIMLKT